MKIFLPFLFLSLFGLVSAQRESRHADVAPLVTASNPAEPLRPVRAAAVEEVCQYELEASFSEISTTDVGTPVNTPPTTCGRVVRLGYPYGCEGCLFTYSFSSGTPAPAFVPASFTINPDESSDPNVFLGAGQTIVTITNSVDDRTCSITVTLTDDVDPVLYAPDAVTIKSTTIMPDLRSLVTDDEDCDFTLTQTPTPGSAIAGTGSIKVIFMATDASGNEGATSMDLVLAATTPFDGLTVSLPPVCEATSFQASITTNGVSFPAGYYRVDFKLNGVPDLDYSFVTEGNPLLVGLSAAVAGSNTFELLTIQQEETFYFIGKTATTLVGPGLLSPATVSGAPVCAGQDVTLNFSVSCPGDATFSAELSDASGGFGSPVGLGSVSPGANSLTIPLGTAAGGGYKIRVVSSNPAFNSESGPFQVKPVVFNSTPTVSLTPACAGGNVKVSFTLGTTCPFPAGNAFTVELSDKNGSFAAPVTLTGTVTPGINTVSIPQNTPTGTSYRVRIVATAEGSSAYSAVSAPFTVNQPAFSSTPSVSGDNKCAGQSVRLSFTVSNCPFFSGNTFTLELSDATGANFVSIPGTVSPGALNNVVIPANTPAGTGYKLRVVSSNPAGTSAASANFKVKTCGGSNREVAPEAAGLQVRVSPNPSPEGRLRIAVTGAEGQVLRVVLFNGTGQSVREQGIERASDEQVLEWDLARQPQGLYLLRVSTGRESKTLKVIH